MVVITQFVQNNGWKKYLSIGLFLAVTHLLSHVLGLNVMDLWYFAIAYSGCFAIYLGVRLNKPPIVLPWVMLLIAYTLFVTGGLIQARTDDNGEFAHYISVADALFVIGYLAHFIALWQFIKMCNRPFPLWGVLDSFIVLIGVFALAWQFLVIPTLMSTASVENFSKVFRLLYPLFSLVVASMLIILNSVQKESSIAFSLFIVGTLFWSSGETYYNIVSMNLDVPTPFNMILWLIAHVCMGAAALHPSMVTIGRNDTNLLLNKGMTHQQHLFMTFSSFCILVVLIVQNFRSQHMEAVGLIIAQLLMSILVWVRINFIIKYMRNQSITLKHLVNIDSLTNLYNRRYFEQKTSLTLTDSSLKTGLLLLDVDRFKWINDSFGHTHGDRVLQAVSQRWQQALAGRGVIARLGGDEFGVLIKDIHQEDSERLLQIAWDLQNILTQPIISHGISFNISASIGGVISPTYGSQYSSLIKCASSAMRTAKRLQTKVMLYDAVLDKEDKHISFIINCFDQAIKNEEFIIYFQPKYSYAKKHVFGVESLVRWQHPNKELLEPSLFIPFIEQTDMINVLTKYVLEKSIAQCARWLIEEGLTLSVSVNLSTRSLLNNTIVNDVQTLLKKYQLPPHLLELEITETSALTDPQQSINTLNKLKALGVILSMDDFGTGFSSLAYLKKLPITILKLDRSFVSTMCVDTANLIIVKATLDMARNLNFEVVAEGVEDTETMKLLQELGCDAVQGYLLSPPVAADQYPNLIQVIEQRIERALYVSS